MEIYLNFITGLFCERNRIGWTPLKDSGAAQQKRHDCDAIQFDNSDVLYLNMLLNKNRRVGDFSLIFSSDKFYLTPIGLRVSFHPLRLTIHLIVPSQKVGVSCV